jgi:hypothetical protein
MEKIKQFVESDKGKDILIVIIVILVGVGSFELGRLSNETNSTGVKVEYPDQNSEQPASVTSLVNPDQQLASATTLENKNFFASSKGSKYYTVSCAAGKTIKQENRVYFNTGEEAETAGYTLSSSCN